MDFNLDTLRTQLLSSGVFLRVCSPEFQSGRLSRSLAGTGVSALSDGFRGVVLNIPEAAIVVEIARDDIELTLAQPAKVGAQHVFRRALQYCSLEYAEWFLSGKTNMAYLAQALELFEEVALGESRSRQGSADEADTFMPLAYLAGDCERATDFYAHCSKPVRSHKTPRRVALALCEGSEDAATHVERLLKILMPRWFHGNRMLEALPWLRIRASLRPAEPSPWSVISGANNFLGSTA